MEETKGWNKKRAQGDIGEMVVKHLIESTPDWKCTKLGVENFESLRRDVKGILSSVTKQIKSMPDFIAFNTKTKEAFFVEAKFRSNVNRNNGKCEVCINFLEEVCEYWKDTKLIIVHNKEPYFFVVDLNNVKKEMCRKVETNEEIRKESISLEEGEIELITNKWQAYWNFADIQKPIKDLFPSLPDEGIKEAINMIKKV